MSKKSIRFKLDIRDRLKSVRQDLEAAQEILGTTVRSRRLATVTQGATVSQGASVTLSANLQDVLVSPELINKMRELREELQEVLDRLNRGPDRLANATNIPEDVDKRSTFYTSTTRPINGYLQWFAVKTWLKSEITVPADQEDPELTDEMIGRLLKASDDVKMVVFKSVETMRESRQALVNSQEYKDLTPSQVLTIVQKFTEVLLIKKTKIQNSELSEEEEGSFGTLEDTIYMSTSVHI